MVGVLYYEFDIISSGFCNPQQCSCNKATFVANEKMKILLFMQVFPLFCYFTTTDGSHEIKRDIKIRLWTSVYFDRLKR